MLKILLSLIVLSLPLSGCHFQSQTKIGGTNLVTPYGTADNLNAERRTDIGVK